MILLTAFEPFGGASVNASQEVARRLADADPALRLVVLPVVRGAAERLALAALREMTDAGTPPCLLLALGEAGKAAQVRLEKAAVNWDDFRIPDNAGNQPRDESIVEGGPATYFATLPLARIADALQEKTPVPVVVSLSAGAYLCNHLAYAVSHALANGFVADPPPFGFVHVPAAREGDEGAVSVEAVAQTVRAIIDLAQQTAPL